MTGSRHVSQGKRFKGNSGISRLRCSEQPQKEIPGSYLTYCVSSKSKTSIDVKIAKYRLVGPLLFGGPGPAYFSLQSDNAFVLATGCLLVCSQHKGQQTSIPLACFKEEKKALLLAWVIPGQAPQERPVGGLSSKGASCSQLEHPQPVRKHTWAHPLGLVCLCTTSLQEIHQRPLERGQEGEDTSSGYKIAFTDPQYIQNKCFICSAFAYPFLLCAIFIHDSKPDWGLLF